MWKLKLCPRCGGDMFLSKDVYGYYEQCLQCSYIYELKNTTEFKRQQIPREKELVQALGTRPKKRPVAVT